MVHASPLLVEGVLLDDDIVFSLHEMCRVCQAEQTYLVALVHEGVLQPRGDGPDHWQFSGTSLGRARTAVRLARDLELGAAATALVLQLLDRIDTLETHLRRVGHP